MKVHGEGYVNREGMVIMPAPSRARASWSRNPQATAPHPCTLTARSLANLTDVARLGS
jgi:hypothetical protein